MPCASETGWHLPGEGRTKAAEGDVGLETLQCEQMLRKSYSVKNSLKKGISGGVIKAVFKFLKEIGRKIKLWYSQIIKVNPKFREEPDSFWWIAFFRRQGESRALSWDVVEGPPASAGPVVPSSLPFSVIWWNSTLCEFIQHHDHFYPPLTFSWPLGKDLMTY